MEKMTAMTINVREDSYKWLKSLPGDEQRALVKAFSDSLDECRRIREYPQEEVEKIVKDAWTEVQIEELRREIEKQHKTAELDEYCRKYPTQCEGHYLIGAMKGILGRA